jgi:isopropylmalate/homocitrate/citramalate synthase
MEDVVLSLLCQYNVNLGIRTEKMCETSRFVLELAKVHIPGNRPIVGDMLYQVESGIVAGFVRKAREKHPLEYVPFAPELVGQKPVSIVLGKNSGLPSVQEWCEKLNLEASEEQMLEMLRLIKEKSFEKKDLLNESEFRAIADRVLSQAAAAS